MIERLETFLKYREYSSNKFGKHIKQTKAININGREIKWSSGTKYLGVHTDSHLWFNKYISKIAHKSARLEQHCIQYWTTAILFKPIRAKINSYKMYIKSKIICAGPAWRALISNTKWTKIKTIQNISLRMISGLLWDVQYDTISNPKTMQTFEYEIAEVTRKILNKTNNSNFIRLRNIFLNHSTSRISSTSPKCYTSTTTSWH